MKKWLAILFIIITVAGSFIPCCGVDKCCSEKLAGAAGHDDHKNEGTCSPFFSCATCPTSVELTKSFQLPTLAIEKIVHHSSALNFELPLHISSFWQPPRMC